MATAKQLSVVLDNKPGKLAAMCKVLAGAKVNILALSVLENADMGVVRLVADKPQAAVRALKRKKICFQEDAVLAVKLPNEVGIMAKVAAKLATKKVNINYAYGSTCGCKGKCDCETIVVLSVDKMSAARKALAGL